MANKEFISDRQGISLIILFLIGEGSIFIQGICAKNDLWLAYILGAIFAFPMIIIFARIHALFPGKNLYDIVEICFGKYLGKLMVIIFIWYAFHAVVLLVEDLSFFVRVVVFPETPNLVFIISFLAISAYITKNGLEVMARWGEILLIVPIILIITVVLFLAPEMKISNITPVLYDGFKPVLKGAFLFFGFPLTYIAGFLLILNLDKQKNSPYKIYILGFLIGTGVLFIIYMLVLLVLGVYHAATLYYPTYVVVSMIDIGGFLQRLDIIAAIIYLIGIYIQANVFLFGACKGMAKLFGCGDYKFIVIPITLLAINLSSYGSSSIMDFFNFAIYTWPFYILPFEAIFPVIIWITAEIRIKMIKKSAKTRII